MNAEANAALARLADTYGRPHAVSAPAFRATRRKMTDSPAPAGATDRYPRANTLSSRKRGGHLPNMYRPKPDPDLAGYARVAPPLTRTSYVIKGVRY